MGICNEENCMELINMVRKQNITESKPGLLMAQVSICVGARSSEEKGRQTDEEGRQTR